MGKKKKEEARAAEKAAAEAGEDDCSAVNPKCKRPTGKQVHWVQCDKCELWSISSVLGSNLTISRRTRTSAAGIANSQEGRAARRRVGAIWTLTREHWSQCTR